MIDTMELREFANDIGYLYGSGPEMRLWLHKCADELDRVTAERDALKGDAEMLDVLRKNLIWDGDGYWLPDLCIKEREWGQNYCQPPTKEEFDAAIRASKEKT